MLSGDTLPTLGQMSAAAAIAKLRELGEEDTAAEIERTESDISIDRPDQFGGPRWRRSVPEFMHTGYAFGFLPARAEDGTIVQLGSVEPDLSLRNSTVTVTLNRMRAVNYPGSGRHCILFEFRAKNWLGTAAEQLSFNLRSDVYDGDHASFIGKKIFVGLHVGVHGIDLGCTTVNVMNEGDDLLLRFLDSEAFKGGLVLAAAAQPAIVPLSGMARGLVRGLTERHRNVKVQEFELGLSFDAMQFGAPLACGSYVVVQTPRQSSGDNWEWREWQYDAEYGHVVRRGATSRELIPYNYMVISVSRSPEEDEPAAC